MNGGVQTQVRQLDPGVRVLNDPSAGLVAVPEVNLAEEAVNQLTATQQFEASAALIRKQEEIDDQLIDILG